MHLSTSSLDGISYITFSITSSSIDLRPRAPVFLSIASLAITLRASSSNSSITLSISNSFWYCFTKAFLGSLRIFTKASSFREFRVAITGNLPTNSGIRPYFGADVQSNNQEDIGEILKNILPEDLLKYGLIQTLL